MKNFLNALKFQHGVLAGLFFGVVWDTVGTDYVLSQHDYDLLNLE